MPQEEGEPVVVGGVGERTVEPAGDGLTIFQLGDGEVDARAPGTSPWAVINAGPATFSGAPLAAPAGYARRDCQ